MKDKQQIQELAPLASVAITVLIRMAIQLAFMFAMLTAIVKVTKENKTLSKKIKSILKDGKDWKIMIIKDKRPNAFCMITPHIFITTGLIKMATPRELEAVLLHEAGHINNKDIWKTYIAEHSITTIVLSIGVLMSGPAGLYMVSLIYFILGMKVLNIVLARTIGRAGEKNADNLAVKYGYHKELISLLKKIEKMRLKYIKKECTTKICQISLKIQEMIDEHPPLKKRVEDILKAKETWTAIKNKSFTQLRDMFQKKLGVDKK